MTTTPAAPPSAAAAVDDPGATPEDALELILGTLIPCLLLSSLSVAAFHGRWRAIREKLGRLQASLSDAVRCPAWPSHPLLLDLLPPLLATLRSLCALSDRCHDPSLPGGKLLLQSDIDIAASSLALRLRDLELLLRSGLLHRSPAPPEVAVDAAGDGGDSNAIVLSQPGAAASKEDLSLFVRDLFTRLQIGGVEFKRKALDSLLHLLVEDGEEVAAKNAAIVSREGDIPCLVRLLEAAPFHHSSIREQAAAAVSALASASEPSRKVVFEEGALGPLLRLLETGSTPLREKAATAIEAITADPANAWAVPAYGGIQVLIEACRPSGSHVVRARAVGSLKNVAAAVVDVRVTMIDEGAVSVLLDLLSTSAGGGVAERDTKKSAAECLCILASAGGEDDVDGEKTRACVIQEGGLQTLLQLFREMVSVPGSSSELAEHLLRAIHALSASPSARKILSASPSLLQLSELIKYGNPATQQIAATLLSHLNPGEEIKRSMAGCISALLKLMESAKPVDSQEVAARALVLLLAVRSNRKELSKDEKSMTRLVSLLDPANDRVRKELPVSVVIALSAGGGGCRKRVSEMGAYQHLQKLAEAEVPGARKALQKITGGRIKSIFSSITWRE